MSFPELPDQGFLWKFYRHPEFPGISRPIPISDFGVPIFSVLGGNEVDMLGSPFVSFVTGESWAGSPNKSIDQIGKNCPKNVPKIVFSAPPDNFSDIFRTFCRHSLFPGCPTICPLKCWFLTNGNISISGPEWGLMAMLRGGGVHFAALDADCLPLSSKSLHATIFVFGN